LFVLSLINNIFPFLAVIALAAIFWYALKQKGDGADLIEKIRQKRVLLTEIILFAMAFYEGLVAAEISNLHNMNYTTRLGVHVVLALFSFIFGLQIYSQVREAVEASVNIKKGGASKVFREWLDAVLSIVLSFTPIILNTWFVILGQKTQVQAWAFITNMLSFKFGAAFVGITDGPTLMSIGICSLHILGSIYLGLFIANSVHSQLTSTAPPAPAPAPASPPPNPPASSGGTGFQSPFRRRP
jgi:hypothetical protein